MANRKYPRKMPPTWMVVTKDQIKHAGPSFACDKCKRRFVVGDKVRVTETQVSWFRGDDEAEYLCESCERESPNG